MLRIAMTEGDTMHDWHEVPDMLRGCAQDDLADRDAVRPTLVAFAGERPLLLARSRPFGPSDAGAALGELFDLVAALGADRVAMAIGGTARTQDLTGIDGLLTDSDLHEVLIIATVERAAVAAAPRCTLTALERRGDKVVCGESVTTDAVSGWLAARLSACVEHASQPAATADVAARVMRCMALGHDLFVAGGAGPAGVRSRAERDDEVVPTDAR